MVTLVPALLHVVRNCFNGLATDARDACFGEFDADMGELRAHGLPSTIFSTRKLLRDRDVAAGFSTVFAVKDVTRPEVPWNLQGWMLLNMNVATAQSSIMHQDMILGRACAFCSSDFLECKVTQLIFCFLYM
jgi:hypothetical protein